MTKLTKTDIKIISNYIDNKISKLSKQVRAGMLSIELGDGVKPSKWYTTNLLHQLVEKLPNDCTYEFENDGDADFLSIRRKGYAQQVEIMPDRHLAYDSEEATTRLDWNKMLAAIDLHLTFVGDSGSFDGEYEDEDEDNI